MKTRNATENNAGAAFAELVQIMNRLRDPGGCPWDREQTFESLRKYLVEETAEALEALDSRDWPHFCEELGDVLLQIVFHSRMAREQNLFTITDVIESISQKMTRRHPHVFGDAQANSPEEVRANWEDLKKAEQKDKPGHKSPVPPALPALQKAAAYASLAKKEGRQVTSDELWRRSHDSLNRLQAATREANRDAAVGSLGDLLLTLAAIGQELGIDAEGAAARAVEAFRKQTWPGGFSDAPHP